MKRLLVVCVAVGVACLCAACDGAGSSADDAGAARDRRVPGGDAGGRPSIAAAKDIASRLCGLLSAPVHDTPLGSFPLMNVEFRPAGEVLFGRVDLDDKNKTSSRRARRARRWISRCRCRSGG